MFHPCFSIHQHTAAQLTGFLSFQSVFSILSSPTPAWRFWHHTGAGSRAQSLGVGGIYHSSAGISFQERVSPLAGLPTGGEKSFLTLSNDMKTFHYTPFHCCSQLLRYPLGFLWAYWCASFETFCHVSKTKSLSFFFH